MSDSEDDYNRKRTGKRLTRKMIGDSLSVLARTGDGLGHAYVHASCADRLCRDIDHLKEFPHLRVVDLAGNRVDDLSAVGELPQLLSLNLDRNNMESLGEFGSLEFLQEVSLEQNKLTEISAGSLSSHPGIERVRLAGNRLVSLDGLSGMARLNVVDARRNRLKETASISDLPALRELYLAENRIVKVDGLESLPALEVLHLRGNRIVRIAGATPGGDIADSPGSDDGHNDDDEDDEEHGAEAGRLGTFDFRARYDPGEEPWRVFPDGELARLREVNLRDNRIASADALAGLRTLPALESISVAGNPLADEDASEAGYRVELLVVIPQLRVIDKVKVTEDERAAAKELEDVRDAERKAEEEARKAEEEARAIAEEEGEADVSEDEEDDDQGDSEDED